MMSCRRFFGSSRVKTHLPTSERGQWRRLRRLLAERVFAKEFRELQQGLARNQAVLKVLLSMQAADRKRGPGARSGRPAQVSCDDDWCRADIVCEVRKAGWSLLQLSLHHGYAAGTLKAALNSRWPKGQRLIAEAIGVAPEDIWPSRYHTNSRSR